MTHTRDEERRRALNLGLLRDERDREVQQAGQGKAAAALLTVSQLLAALCVLQGDPAWTVLLSLTFVAGAARAFHQFACDRAGLYLALGLAASAAALTLCGWYVFHVPALSLGRLAGLLLLFLALNAVTALVFLGLTLGAFWLKFQVQHMDTLARAQRLVHQDTAHRVGQGKGQLVRLGVAQADGQAALRVPVDQQHFLSGLRQPNPQVRAGGCLANAAFLVGDGDDLRVQ